MKTLDIQETIVDESAILHTLTQDYRGKIRGVSCVYAFVKVDGVLYRAERQIRLAFTKAKNQPNPPNG